MSSRFTQIILVAGAIILIVVLLLAPQLPSEKRKLASADPIDQKINQAINLVQGGENPMQGIAILREILAEDSTNAKVHWHLAQFSVQSGQLENAVSRFEKVIKFDEEKEFKEAYFWLGQIHLNFGNEQEALFYFEEYRNLETDTVVTNGVNRIIDELNNNNDLN